MERRPIFKLDTIIEWGLALLFLGAVLLNFANVIGRYGLGASIFGADEIQVFILVIIAFIGVIAVSLRDEHLKMDVFINMFPARLRHGVRLLEWTCFTVICGYVAYYSFLYTSRMRSLGRLSDMAELPVWYFHASVTVSFAAMSLIGLGKLRLALRGRAAATSSTTEAR